MIPVEQVTTKVEAQPDGGVGYSHRHTLLKGAWVCGGRVVWQTTFTIDAETIDD